MVRSVAPPRVIRPLGSPIPLTIIGPLLPHGLYQALGVDFDHIRSQYVRLQAVRGKNPGLFEDRGTCLMVRSVAPPRVIRPLGSAIPPTIIGPLLPHGLYQALGVDFDHIRSQYVPVSRPSVVRTRASLKTGGRVLWYGVWRPPGSSGLSAAPYLRPSSVLYCLTVCIRP
ncbi:uncharacterized protein LOC143035850 [Oratosquilla oratoria]|uniref:uncharacterized protein LOC143035850 n=1 Tax=Oratosquilla oratoria TaxID=337810 RepID=UPI003F773568